MIHKNLYIKLLVINALDVGNSCMSVFFTRPIGFSYESGDWIDLNFTDGNPVGGTTYSLSSSPTEDSLSITFRIGISPFKKRLQSLKAGDELYISQYGNDYDFHLKENRSSVLIAGGIGIAPFRSILKEMHDTDNQNDVQLVYLNKQAPFVFADEIDAWQKDLPNLRVDYVETGLLNRKKREKLLTTIINKIARHYFIAGPEGMVEATEHLLIDVLDVSPKDIRIDNFGTY